MRGLKAIDFRNGTGHDNAHCVRHVVLTQRIGDQLLQKIREYLQDWYGIILEVENPDRAESEEERVAQEHRIAFYLRNHVALTDVTLTLFGVPFRMMYLEGFKIKAEEVEMYLKEIYHMMFPDEIYNRVVKF